MNIREALCLELAALQKSGQHDWRKRVSRLNPEEELTEATQNHNGSTPTGRRRGPLDLCVMTDDEAFLLDLETKHCLRQNESSRKCFHSFCVAL
ncbi:hypothetical protein J437_LFUL011813 [Ladona fulva]|uniref:Uncharacterized protein n=1 Tax=Ladona fulva TaxID=123851 RepID=A0A8K0P194_LADFU|nr:hypothetical protein J437_LFUL011813 [Ladona fulva]